jgi:hypothetical protein
MKYIIIYARSGMGRTLFSDQTRKIERFELAQKVRAVIPDELQRQTNFCKPDGVQVVMWESRDPASQAIVIAIEV